jgi:hypothetical protein
MAFYKKINILIDFIVLSFFLSLKAYSADLTVNQTVHITSITYQWNAVGTNNYTTVLSTHSDFSYPIISETISTNSTDYLSLKGNTQYYFKVKISTKDDSAYTSVSTVTYTQTPYNIEAIYNQYQSETIAQIVINFPDENAPDTTYQIDYSSNVSYNPKNSKSYTGVPPFPVNGLLTNTTYYFKVKAFDRKSRPTNFSESFSTQTVAKTPDDFNTQIYETSSTFNWSPINGLKQENSSSGYKLLVTEDAEYKIIVSSYNIDKDIGSQTIENLTRNTGYYYKFSVLNSIGVESFIPGSFYTLTSKPSNFKIINYSSSSVRAGWNRFPSSPPSDTALLFRLEASTTTNFINIISSITYDMSISTLSIDTLDSNTTYYFRVGAFNMAGYSNYSDILSTLTLSMPIHDSTIEYIKTPRSITAVFPKSPKYLEPLTSYGYSFEISTNNFFSVYLSSYTPDVDDNSLTISGLRPNTTYYLRLATYNRSMVPNYSEIRKELTPLPQISPDVFVTYYSSNTVSIHYSTVDADGYVVELSPSNDFSSISYSSATYSNDISTLTITPVNSDTLYYIREGSLFPDATIYKNAEPYYIRTLSPPPSDLQIDSVNISSITMRWTPSSCKGYSLEASTSSQFTNPITSVIMNPDLSVMSVGGLKPNTTYYLRVGSINSANAKNYITSPSTPTLANFTIEKPLTRLTTYSMQINWDKNSNPDDTLYDIEISSTGFTDGIIYSSKTYNSFAYFDSLKSNSTYYKRITSLNRAMRPTGPISFTPVATLAYKPHLLTVNNSTRSINVIWDDTNNASGTPYLVEVSSTNFESIISSRTLMKSSTFYDLNANTPYFLRLSAINFSGIPSEYESYITTTCVEIPSISTPTFLNVLLDGFTAQWSNNYNSTHTIYSVEASTKTDFSTIFRSVDTMDTILVFPDLNYNTQYYIRIKAKGLIPNNESDYFYLGSISTLYREEQTIDNKKEEIVSIPYSYGAIQVIIPPYALGSATKVFIEPDLNPPAPKSKAGNLRPTGFAARVYIFPVVLYNGFMEVRIPFSTIPSSFDMNKLILARYDESAKLWVPIESYQENNYIVGKTYHFSTFQIMEFEESQSVEDVKIYPNPYKPNTNMGKVNFSNMPGDTDIHIYTVMGKLIKKLKANKSGFVQWDSKNSDGREVASGVYLVIFKDKNGNKVIKKLAIEK